MQSRCCDARHSCAKRCGGYVAFEPSYHKQVDSCNRKALEHSLVLQHPHDFPMDRSAGASMCGTDLASVRLLRRFVRKVRVSALQKIAVCFIHGLDRKGDQEGQQRASFSPPNVQAFETVATTRKTTEKAALPKYPGIWSS